MSMGALVQFHSQYKFLLLAYSEQTMREMGRVVANQDRKSMAEVFKEYDTLFRLAFAQPARTTAFINALEHVKGYFSKVIQPGERAFIEDSIEMYREERVPLSVPLNLLRANAIRFENEYINNQVFFEPFPMELMSITDSGKGRKLD
jgi:uncharacterized protein YbgA (DUF1722 family)